MKTVTLPTESILDLVWKKVKEVARKIITTIVIWYHLTMAKVDEATLETKEAIKKTSKVAKIYALKGHLLIKGATKATWILLKKGAKIIKSLLSGFGVILKHWKLILGGIVFATFGIPSIEMLLAFL